MVSIIIIAARRSIHTRFANPISISHSYSHFHAKLFFSTLKRCDAFAQANMMIAAVILCVEIPKIGRSRHIRKISRCLFVHWYLFLAYTHIHTYTQRGGIQQKICHSAANQGYVCSISHARSLKLIIAWRFSSTRIHTHSRKKSSNGQMVSRTSIQSTYETDNMFYERKTVWHQLML